MRFLFQVPELLVVGCSVLLASGCTVFAPRMPMSDSSAVSRQLAAQALAAMERDQWALAEKHAAGAVAACPDDPDARRCRAEVLWRRGDRSAAVEQMAALAGRGDAATAIHVRLAEMHLELGRQDLAAPSAERAVESDPASPAAWAVRGQVMRAGGRLHEALADFHRAMAMAPDDRRIAWEVAELYRELGRPQRALALLSSLAAAYPPGEEPGGLFYLQGLAQTELGRYDDAVASFTKSILRERPTAEVLYHLARAEMLSGRSADAAAAAREALALDPGHHPSRELLGRLDLAIYPTAAMR